MPSSAPAIRVAIVNDYPIVVEGLARLIEADVRFDVVELDLQTAVEQPVDLVLFDAFGRQDRIADETAELAARHRAGRIAVFSWNLDEDLVASALEHGADAYLSKRLTGPELIDALMRVHAGERVVDRAASSSEAASIDVDPGDTNASEWPGKAAGLSAREAEIVALIAQGATNDEIAQRCYLSINSVKTHIRNAYRKMGVERRSQAVRWALEHDMLRPSPRRITRG